MAGIVKREVAESRESLGRAFVRDMESLFVEIKKCELHFVKCIKPNLSKKAFELDRPYLLKQLRYQGIL